jgi:hypothetical protein
VLTTLQLPAAAPGPPARAPLYGVCGQAPPGETAGWSRPAPGRQRLLAERAVLQLAWIGLLAVREGFTCQTPPSSLMPEPWVETVEPEVAADTEGRAISAYRKAARLAAPRAVPRVDTHA